MNANSTSLSPSTSTLPPDDLRRQLALVQPNAGQPPPHIGIVRDTYTLLLTGEDTAGRYCLIDMHVPPGGGPPPHRHDFEEMFTMLDGEIEVTFRGANSVVRAGETINIPSNAPHEFHNTTERPVRLLCMCAPSGLEAFFLAVGVPVASRTAPPPTLDEAAQAAYKAKYEAIAPQYRMEFLPHA